MTNSTQAIRTSFAHQLVELAKWAEAAPHSDAFGVRYAAFSTVADAAKEHGVRLSRATHADRTQTTIVSDGQDEWDLRRVF